MLSIPFAAIGIILLGVAAWFCVQYWRDPMDTKNMITRLPYRDAAQMATLFFLAAIAARLLGW